MNKADRRDLRRLSRELLTLLNDWDPIGVGPNGPEDEYDCLVWPVMRQLQDHVPVPDLVAFLKVELAEHFGLEPQEPGIVTFAARAQTWFESHHSPTHG